MPLTDFQREILSLLAEERSLDSYLAGGAALHFSPNSDRYSDDLDFFHDSEERVASAFTADRNKLRESGFSLGTTLSQPGFIRTVVSRGGQSTRIDWSHDSAWRFMPPVKDELGGFVLHDIDLAINKLLALSGRDEPRDYVDILYAIDSILGLGGLCWAAVGKDAGLTPASLIELLRRRGRHRQEAIDRLNLASPFDLVAAKSKWTAALDAAEAFVATRPEEELGCLYYSKRDNRFVEPDADRSLEDQELVTHFGSPGGVLPQTPV